MTVDNEFNNKLDKISLSHTNSNDIKNSPLARTQQDIDVVERIKNNLLNSGEIYQDIQLQFEKKTALKGKDISFLFIATALQTFRIFGINKLLEVQKAGKGNIEKTIKERWKKLADKITYDSADTAREFHAPLKQIYEGRGVPFDATAFDTDVWANGKPIIFKGANHRFSTVGHDPFLGLFIGTANIITNTITVYSNESILKIGEKIDIHNIKSYHVRYDDNLKNPVISSETLTLEVIYYALVRILKDKDTEDKENGLEVFLAAFAKQILHIATDLFTPCGIPLPMINSVLDKKFVEEFTKNISFGDVIKQGMQALFAWLINLMIKFMYKLICRCLGECGNEYIELKAEKIIAISNGMASGSSVLYGAISSYFGNVSALKDADIGGFFVAIREIYKIGELQAKLKEEFIEKELCEQILCFNE